MSNNHDRGTMLKEKLNGVLDDVFAEQRLHIQKVRRLIRLAQQSESDSDDDQDNFPRLRAA